MIKNKDIIQRPFFVWIGTLVIVLLLALLRETGEEYSGFEMLVFGIDVLVGMVFFLVTIFRVLKEKSIIYSVATVTAFFLFFYVLSQAGS